MPTTSERRRAFSGPTLFSHGFRVFFLSAGIWAAAAMILWLAILVTGQSIPSRYSGADWHMHEMVFGYTTAVIAGFLLTAVPNWTGRMPVLGWPVAGLAGLWLAGRFAIFVSAWLPEIVSPVVDSSFLIVLVAVLAREIIAGKNYKNLKVLGVVSVLAVSNIVFHIEVLNNSGYGGYGIRLGVGTIILLIILIGGRVVPSFTRNWLARQGQGKLPTPFNRFDAIASTFAVITLASWVLAPHDYPARVLAAIAAVLHFARLYRWVGWRATAEPLVTILHAGYIFVPLGFLMVAIDSGPNIPHAWMVGAIGVVTMAMMTRASLGHSGRKLTATASIKGIYVAIILAAVLRSATELMPDQTYLLYMSAIAWIIAFVGFVIVYYPLLAKPRI